MSAEKCYLAGGTAIALMLGHRKSVDLDWFTGNEMQDPAQIVQRMKSHLLNILVPVSNITIDKGTIYATANDVRLSILEYHYPLLEQSVDYAEAGCRLAGLDDLSCMKLTAVATRGSRKDFTDIYALLEKHASLQHMFEAYTKKFSDHNISHTVFSLTYFDDAEKEQMPEMLWNVSWDTIKSRILAAVKEVGG